MTPCEIPKDTSDLATLAGAATVAIFGTVDGTRQVLTEVGSQAIVAYNVEVKTVLAGKPSSSVVRVIFNVAPQSEPIRSGQYVLFLLPADTGAEGDYLVAYGIRGSFHVDDSNLVHPVCIDSENPGHPVDGDTSASLASFEALVASVDLQGPPGMQTAVASAASPGSS